MDLPSDSDESDVDFVPEGELSHSDAESEAEANAETDAQFETERNNKLKKRKARNSKKQSKRKKTNETDDVATKENVQKNLDPVEEKKREDDLWASFLSDTPKPEKSVTDTKSTEITDVAKSKSPVIEKSTTPKNEPVNKAPSKLESIIAKHTEKPATSSISSLSSPLNKLPKPAGGLSAILGQIGKKSKLTTLEKSKQDWTSFKKDEGIEEELTLHNKGKAGYLDRQDFLERTDLRQFEIEKNLRTSKRSSNR